MTPKSIHPARAILFSGGVAAALDITYAILRYNPSNPKGEKWLVVSR
ncbi:MAG TPA: hypothetical protein VK629_03505 [Steroidobacteraceae bacterium]|nr:hypothetical protein [Steroidobacteraceae bacterium]